MIRKLRFLIVSFVGCWDHFILFFFSQHPTGFDSVETEYFFFLKSLHTIMNQVDRIIFDNSGLLETASVSCHRFYYNTKFKLLIFFFKSDNWWALARPSDLKFVEVSRNTHFLDNNKFFFYASRENWPGFDCVPNFSCYRDVANL